MSHNRMLSRFRRPQAVARLLVIPVLALGLALGGCANKAKQRAALLEEENVELRMLADQLEDALADAENGRAMSESELRALRAEKQRLEAELARKPDVRTVTGFEGLPGVSTSTRGGEIVVDVAGDVLFDSGKATLRSDSKKTLNQIANVLNSSYGGKMIRIAGHTDSDPIRKSGWKTNERLSSERALAVEEYLASQGVSKDRMYAAAFGPSMPKGSKKQSRRVEIIILSANAPS